MKKTTYIDGTKVEQDHIMIVDGKYFWFITASDKLAAYTSKDLPASLQWHQIPKRARKFGSFKMNEEEYENMIFEMMKIHRSLLSSE